MTMSIRMGRGQSLLTATFILGLIAFSTADIADDLAKGASISHVGLEAAVVATGIAALIWIGWQIKVAKRASAELQKKLVVAHKEAAEWRNKSQELLKGLGRAIDDQFHHWQLTAAEREVALFILKGFSMKDISSFRNTSERTCRQQAAEIYRKSGLGGRAEFSAFFLEDLLLPIQS